MYDEYYGFSGKPFQLTPDQRFFFNSPGHSRALAYLRYGIEQREGFVVITGGVGTGKTMLVLTLLDELDGKDIVAGQLVTTQVDPEDMLRMVCATFGLGHDGLNKSGMLDLLYTFALDQRRDGRRILLVVDEAQNLPAASLEELRMLANYQVDGQSLFQSFLLGQEELRSTLQGPGMEQLRQRIIAAHHLDPLSVEETRSYIDYRLACVNWHGVPVFQDGVVERIHGLCSGVPRMINGLCDRLLLFGCIEERQTLDIRDVDKVGLELRREVGTTSLYGGGTDQGAAEQLTSRRGTPTPEGSGAEPRGEQLAERISRLEGEVSRLRQLVKRERQLLRKAILIQLDLGAYDDFE
jgi:putative secretion ATPase (PEP-CTERM system associated)